MLFLLQLDNSNLLFALQNGERSVLNTDLHYFYCWYCFFKNQFIWTPTGINYSVELVMKTPRKKHEIQRDRLPMYKAAANSNLKLMMVHSIVLFFKKAFKACGDQFTRRAAEPNIWVSERRPRWPIPLQLLVTCCLSELSLFRPGDKTYFQLQQSVPLFTLDPEVI